MAKNLISEICKLLGVELGEEFKLKSANNGRSIKMKFFFKDNELYIADKFGEICTRNDFLPPILRGELEIVKLPWKPNYRQEYWTFGLKDGVWVVVSREWEDYPAEILLFDKGWVFRTKEEAQAALPKVAKEMGVDYGI